MNHRVCGLVTGTMSPTPFSNSLVVNAGRTSFPAFLLPTGTPTLPASLLRKRGSVMFPTSHLASYSGTHKARRRRECLCCELTRLSGNAGHKVLPALATTDQWAHFWGATEVQRMGKLVEVASIVFVGLWACFFTSFFLGVGTTSIIGSAGLFYWLLVPNLTAFRRNRALRGRISPFPGGEGNSVAIFSARVASATEEYHPVTGRPVFLRMVIEDEEGRALKFRTRTRSEYARIRAGMAAEAILVSPDEAFDEIVGVSDTFIPAANIWVGEYPYVDKTVFRRLLASRDSRKRRGDLGDDAALDAVSYQDFWGASRVVPAAGNSSNFQYDEEDDDDDDDDEPGEPRYEGWGSAGFSSNDRRRYRSGDMDGMRRAERDWERVSRRPRPRREAPRSDRRDSQTSSMRREGYDYGTEPREAVRRAAPESADGTQREPGLRR